MVNLYHYTDTNGLIGILNSRQIWATHASFTNDRLELEYGINRALQIVESLISKHQGKDKLYHEMALSFLDDQLVRRKQFGRIPNIFISCFSEKEDLLSQWRAYASGGCGFSIGFDFDGHILKDENKTLRKVIYQEEEQIHLIKSILEVAENDTTQFSLSNMIRDLRIASFIFKHPSFIEEQEWRILVDFENHIPEEGISGMGIRFRESKKKLVPYIVLNLANSKLEKSEDLPQIKTITSGPSNDQDNTETALQLALCSLGYDNGIIIKKSESSFYE